MLDPDLLTDPDPRVAALLAVSPILNDYVHEIGRRVVAAIIPGIAPVHADDLITEITEHLAAAEDEYERRADQTLGEALRADFIEFARDAARQAIRNAAKVAA